MKFAEDFVFGAATAAYQAEGAVNEDGRGRCYWDKYLEGRFDPSMASDFYHRYPEDLANCEKFGVNGIRISIAWARVIPDGKGEVNEAGLAFYDKLIDECLAHGVEPFVTLHHFDTPEPLYEAGDWLNRENLPHFVRFAKVCFERFGHKVKKWITINEPYSVVAGQYVIGHFPPNIHYDIPKALQAAHNMVLGHSMVVNAYKEMNLPGEIGIVHILEGKYAYPDTPENQKAAKIDDTFANRWLLESTFKGRYTDETMATINEIVSHYDGELDLREEDFAIMEEAAKKLDFLGMNYYASHFCQYNEGGSGIFHNGTGTKGTSVFALKGISKRVSNPNVPTTDWDWPIYPEGLYDMLTRIARDYSKCKVYVTENGLGDKEVIDENGKVVDDKRIDYISKHMNAILKANQDGANCCGYFLWSLMDVFSWTNGYNKRYGLFFVDFETQQRTMKKSAYWYKEISAKKELVDPATIEY